MVVRYASASDLPRLVELARREHAKSVWRRVPFDAEAAAITGAGFVSLMGRTALCTDGGYLFGLVQPLGFSQQRIAIEFAWYAEDGQGMALLRAFERWARSMRCHAVIVHSYTGERVAQLLWRRSRYQPMGQALYKTLER